MKHFCICANCIKHPSMKGYYKCNHTGQLLGESCFVWKQCKNAKATLRYKLHMLIMNYKYKRSYKK